MNIIKNIILLFLLSIFSNLFSINWYDNFEVAISASKRLSKPLIVLIYSPRSRKCKTIDYQEKNGYYKSLPKKFIFCKIYIDNITTYEDLSKLPSTSKGAFYLYDFNEARKDYITKKYLSNRTILDEISKKYYKVGEYLYKKNSFIEARKSLHISASIDSEFAKKAEKVIAALNRSGLIDKEKKEFDKNRIKNENNNSIKNGLDYYNRAVSYLEKEKHLKAYIYFEKTIELLPKKHKYFIIAKKKLIYLEDKVDKSKIISKSKIEKKRAKIKKNNNNKD